MKKENHTYSRKKSTETNPEKDKILYPQDEILYYYKYVYRYIYVYINMKMIRISKQ